MMRKTVDLNLAVAHALASRAHRADTVAFELARMTASGVNVPGLRTMWAPASNEDQASELARLFGITISGPDPRGYFTAYSALPMGAPQFVKMARHVPKAIREERLKKPVIVFASGRTKNTAICHYVCARERYFVEALRQFDTSLPWTKS